MVISPAQIVTLPGSAKGGVFPSRFSTKKELKKEC
jgi:hypothetical protein